MYVLWGQMRSTRYSCDFFMSIDIYKCHGNFVLFAYIYFYKDFQMLCLTFIISELTHKVILWLSLHSFIFPIATAISVLRIWFSLQSRYWSLLEMDANTFFYFFYWSLAHEMRCRIRGLPFRVAGWSFILYLRLYRDQKHSCWLAELKSI